MHRIQAIESPGRSGNAVQNAVWRTRAPGVAKQMALLWSGYLLMGLGFAGILLPLMPTTVFWIGAAVCFARSSPERYRRLVGHGRRGQVIRNFLEDGVIPTTGKWVATLGMLMSATLLWYAPLGNVATMVGLLGILSAATYVITRPESFPPE